MPDFAASLTNPSTSTVALATDGTNLTIGDYSNYIASTENGHYQADFGYKKITLTLPDASTYVFATIPPYDELINAPATYVAVPNENTYAYSIDGVFEVNLLTLPRWDTPYTYQQYDTVLASGAIYEATQTNTNKDPLTQTAYWTLITDESLVRPKYNVTEYIAITDLLELGWKSKMTQLVCTDVNVVCDSPNICENKTYRQAERLDDIITAIPILVEDENWTLVQDVINDGSTIINC